MKRFYILVILLVCLTINRSLAVWNVACNYEAISNACALATEGTNILIAPGSCQFSNTITIDRNVSFWIQGSGTNSTYIISPVTGIAFTLKSVSSSNVFTFSDMNCIGVVADTFGFFNIGVNAPTLTPFKNQVHLYNIQMTNVLGRGISIGYGDSFGCIDHSYFVTKPGGSAQSISFGGNEYRSWTNMASSPIGTTNAVYVEDCYFDNSTNGGNGFFDSYNGSRIVWRHNYCTGNAPSGVHGYDSQVTSAQWWDINNNIFTNITSSVLAVELRGGTGVVWSNKTYGAVDFCQLAYYRTCQPSHAGTVKALSQPGQGYEVNFANTPWNGWAFYFNGNPVDGNTLTIGYSTYTFRNSYASTAGLVVIGATAADTIANLFNAMNLGPGSGTVYGSSTKIGYSFKGIAYTATDLILTNNLDNNADVFGYPANQQPGILWSYPNVNTNSVNSQTVWPAWAWGNTMNGTNINFNLKDNTGTCSFNITNYLKEGRDYSNAMPSALVYTPLVYPHPLQGQENQTITTNLSISANPSPSTNGVSVVFTATVQTNSVTASDATGTVTFLTNGVTMGTASLSSGVATYSNATIPVGTWSITATWPGSGGYGALTSGTLSQIVYAVYVPTSTNIVATGQGSLTGTFTQP